MSKPRKIKLSIPKPCSEDWDNMTLKEQGRFCERCNNIIIDFSNFTDRELVNIISKSQEHACGRFNTEQLNRVIVVNESTNVPLFRKLLLGASLTAGVLGTASAQNTQPPVNNSKTTVDNNTRTQDRKKSLTNDFGYIKGQVIDSTNQQPIPFANVSLFLSGNPIDQIATTTDFEGYFHFKISNEYFEKKLTVRFQVYGYKDTSIDYLYKNDSSQKILCKMSELMIAKDSIIVIRATTMGMFTKPK